jgi:two-component system NarL family sensor kinase
MLVRSVEASTDERRRIAADLHDGVVQDLAGISYALSAAAEQADGRSPAETRAALREAAADTRDAMRRLRSLVVDIHPPNLRASGLEAALSDLLAPLAADGVEISLRGADVPLPDDVELLFYRGAAEALRNTRRHAHASRVAVRVARNGDRARLEVVDDGVGFTDTQRAERRAEGHVGLSLLEELAGRARGRLEVTSTPGGGTSFVLEAPAT